MTRFIHDQFAKDYLEELLSPYGEVKIPRRVPSEVREIDIWFDPYPQTKSELNHLGLLGKISQSPTILEPFRNPVTPDEIGDCLLKLLELKSLLQREANRHKIKLNEVNLPRLWILTPTASSEILSGVRATIEGDWGEGIYFLGATWRSAIVVIHQLPRTPDTLWLRLLGRGNVQKQAINELESLAVTNPYRETTLKLLYSLQKNLEITQSLDEDDQELIMRLSPLYQQDREQAIREGIEQGIEQGQRIVIENLLKTRFGELDAELIRIIESLLTLPPQEYTSLLLQLSREELIVRFGN